VNLDDLVGRWRRFSEIFRRERLVPPDLARGMQQLGEQLIALDVPADINFRCAACTAHVGRRKAGHRHQFGKRGFHCRTHGPLASPTLGDIHDEWTHRGKPKTLNVMCMPVD
jgi:hypothetical protein